MIILITDVFRYRQENLDKRPCEWRNSPSFFYHVSAQMGYATPDQTAGGLHFRLYSRAFIVDDGSKRVVFVTADIGMASQRLRLEVGRVWCEDLGVTRKCSSGIIPYLIPSLISSSYSEYWYDGIMWKFIFFIFFLNTEAVLTIILFAFDSLHCLFDPFYMRSGHFKMTEMFSTLSMAFVTDSLRIWFII